jgi:Rps23 Pro-64 3,4-dihydroxylase Tpa1-like proline 4-hydroxylase
MMKLIQNMKKNTKQKTKTSIKRMIIPIKNQLIMMISNKSHSVKLVSISRIKPANKKKNLSIKILLILLIKNLFVRRA